MTNADLEKIKRNAVLLAEQAVSDPADRPAYVAAYVAAHVTLNDRVERRMDRLQDDLTELLGALLPGIPGLVADGAEKQSEHAHKLAATLADLCLAYAHPSVCVLVTKAVRDSLGYMSRLLPDAPH